MHTFRALIFFSFFFMGLHLTAWARPVVNRDDLKFNSAPPKPRFMIKPAWPVNIFHQWGANDGYCGEASFTPTALNLGAWISQYQARLLCGAGLSQSGPNGFCAKNKGNINFNAQMMFEDQAPGDERFASAGQCLKNAKLDFSVYDYSHAKPGWPGYKEFLSWVKSEMIKGHVVAIGVLNFDGTDPQYDHDVTVAKIGTRHSPKDSRYYDDDVLYFEDHGNGGRAFTKGYTFKSLAKDRKDASGAKAQNYSILIPGEYPIYSLTGGDGVNPSSRAIRASNYGFSIAGVADAKHVTLPVSLLIKKSESLGKVNPTLPEYGLNYESPELKSDCTNEKPESAMQIELEAKVQGLTPGVAYVLYEYDQNTVSGLGDQAALAVPDRNFNLHAELATHITHFIAKNEVFLQTLKRTSDQVVSFRCVRADAP